MRKLKAPLIGMAVVYILWLIFVLTTYNINPNDVLFSAKLDFVGLIQATGWALLGGLCILFMEFLIDAHN